MEPVSGMDVLAAAHRDYPELPVIMMTGYGTVETALQSLKMGAFDYVTKPFKLDPFMELVNAALARWKRAGDEHGISRFGPGRNDATPARAGS